MSRPRLLLVVLAVACALGAGTAVAKLAMEGRIGPSRHLVGSGRRLHPAGRLVKLGNFPTGGALTPDGRFYWTLSTGRGINDIRIVSVKRRQVVQKIVMPGLSGGIAMDPVHHRAYVSGIAESGHADERVPDKVPGQEGDVIQVLSYDEGSGQAKREGVIPVPPPSDTPPAQDFPPGTARISWPDRLAISPDGKRLLVPLNLADRAAIVDVRSKAVKYVETGSYPYGAAILPDGKTGLVSNEGTECPRAKQGQPCTTPDGTSTVSVIDLASAKKVKDIAVGSAHAHPEAIAVDPKADRAYVALANEDQVVVLDTSGRPSDVKVDRTLSTHRSAGDGTSPVDLAVRPDGAYLVVAEAGADELAVFRLPTRRHGQSRIERRAQEVLSHEAQAAAARHDRSGAGRRSSDPEERRAAGVHAQRHDYELVGRIPVADYAADVDIARVGRGLCSSGGRDGCFKLVWIAGKGLGVGPNPHGPNPYKINDDNALSQHYLPAFVRGWAGLLDFPGDSRIRRLTPVASRQLRPANAQKAPKETPLRPGGPIKHVFYVVKENRTYDQILGDVKKGDGDPDLALFGRRVTPNAHALVQRFPLVDHVYANSEASIDGHFWTSAAKVSDYVHKNWNQNYGARNRPYDFGVYSITWPQDQFLFDQAERQGISYFNFGEAIAGTVPLTDKDRTGADTAEVAKKFAKSDLGPPVPGSCYTNDAFIVKNALTQDPATDPSPPRGDPLNTESRFNCFREKFGAQLAGGTVPAFTYLVLPEDHTEGATPGKLTPRAHVARNDHALGQLTDLISHSSIWQSSAIFVIEDDSQDGADHVDAHRVPAFVISPYARQGAVVHTRYDFLSVIRSMELILGMEPLGLFDRLATPMYDVFSAKPRNARPFDVLGYRYNASEKNPDTAANRAMTHGLNLNFPDQVSQEELDRQIWKTIYGPNAQPPPPGPNANRGQ